MGTLLVALALIAAGGYYALERPSAPAISTTGEFEGSWPGCVHLDRWQTFRWVRVGSARDASDATGGVWEAPQVFRSDCSGFAIVGTLHLPEHAGPGIYRVCGDSCVEIDFRP